MSLITVSADWNYFQETSQPGWWAIQNPWNNGSLVNGRDYTQTVTADTSQFPNATVLSWSWPAYANADNVWGYPELVYGTQAGTWKSPDGNGPTPVQVKNLSALNGSFNLTLGGSTDQYDVLWETHLTSAPNSGQLAEFGIFLHEPTYLRNFLNTLPNHYAYSAAGLSATIYVTSNGVQPYIIVSPTTDILSGTIDLKAILATLTAHGVITGNEYIEGFEMGAEPAKGSGSLTVNSIGYDWNGNLVGTNGVSPPPPPPPSPGATIKIQNGSNPAVTLDGSQVQSQTVYGASVAVTAPAVAVVVLGSLHDQIQFTGMTSVNVTVGSASSTVSADAGSNTFTAGSAALTVSGGSGSDTYVFHKNDVLTIKDFAQAKGDAIDADSSLAGTAYERSDRHGGSNIYFHGSSGHIHLIGVTAFPLTAIHFSG